MTITKRQREYAEARAAGLPKRAAAIAAGCPEKTASQAATTLEKAADVRAHWERIGFVPPVVERKPKAEKQPREPKKDSVQQAAERIAERAARPASQYDDPLDFLRDVVNDQCEDQKLRLEAAKAWDAGLRGRAATKGKKGEAEDRAKKAANRFAPVAAPGLKVVK